MKVSFDFDDTLSKPKVQEYAKELIERGVEVYIVTARYSNKTMEWMFPNVVTFFNSDLYLVADTLKIHSDNIIFMDMVPKNEYLKTTNILWHLDDCGEELVHIRTEKQCKTLPINVLSASWKTKCERILRNYECK